MACQQRLAFLMYGFLTIWSLSLYMCICMCVFVCFCSIVVDIKPIHKYISEKHPWSLIYSCVYFDPHLTIKKCILQIKRWAETPHLVRWGSKGFTLFCHVAILLIIFSQFCRHHNLCSTVALARSSWWWSRIHMAWICLHHPENVHLILHIGPAWELLDRKTNRRNLKWLIVHIRLVRGALKQTQKLYKLIRWHKKDSSAHKESCSWRA